MYVVGTIFLNSWSTFNSNWWTALNKPEPAILPMQPMLPEDFYYAQINLFLLKLLHFLSFTFYMVLTISSILLYVVNLNCISNIITSIFLQVVVLSMYIYRTICKIKWTMLLTCNDLTQLFMNLRVGNFLYLLLIVLNLGHSPSLRTYTRQLTTYCMEDEN